MLWSLSCNGARFSNLRRALTLRSAYASRALFCRKVPGVEDEDHGCFPRRGSWVNTILLPPTGLPVCTHAVGLHIMEKLPDSRVMYPARTSFPPSRRLSAREGEEDE